MLRSYFYRTNGMLWGPPPQLRHSQSNFSGQIPNKYGDNWQEAADNLKKLALLHGSIVKIDLSDSLIYQGFMEFTIFFDAIQSAKMLHDYVHTLNALMDVPNMLDMAYNETP
ncbi:unnamed protein product [Rotaria magnacalcarata]|uniref:Uncharacterized protein n=2 Tax=Rotaria magnacalcarata TaxID=392030 RepID=A0A819YKL5_9BILA|nr:unnamed protein product [Rotaria magnacalcarata]CAF2118324.1 unnamed protein product [Rotaria magnacalcarata]CAF2122334.1 unnamed protein product [Rotaria magnacalcarata]CAF2161015.1 unnamed protein product [Rotaria magnacalcarata]CAF3926486.1 unnamed protein product [Rotaria magnacalcarata]